jgi:hypothetical protein
MRVSISKAHDQYLKSLASQMGTTDMSECLTFLLWKLREANYNFGGHLPTYATAQQPQQAVQPQQHFDPTTFETRPTAMSALSFQPAFPDAVREFEQVQDETDPVIERLLSLGLESF